MPKWLINLGIITVVLSWIPLAIIAKNRYATSGQPRWHVWVDMDDQESYKAQKRSPLFDDRMTSRLPVPGTVARGAAIGDSSYTEGKIGDDFIDALPQEVTLSRELLVRGELQYQIHCFPCHGMSGYGDGPVAQRAMSLAEGTWTLPSSFHDQPVRSKPVGSIYNTIANGIRNMPAYGHQIPLDDRWAIAAYVKVLQRSQDAGLDDVPAEERGRLE